MHGIIAFALISLPGFFVATGLLVLFSNPDVLDWFPSSGVKDLSTFDPNWTFLKRVQHYAPYLILPIFCFTYASAAFISIQVRNSIREQMKQDYIRTARAKGISETRILIQHALRNSLSPIITLFGQSMPMLFGGSVIIESIFSIPGMGLEIYESVINYDYPMIVALFTIIGFLTMLGNLISDILYAWADPRVRYISSNDRL
jgi:peptide/nickel transport system permease protein